MRGLLLAAGLGLLLAIGGCSSDDDVLMPDVTGQMLDGALSDIERAGLSKDVEVVGGGIFGIVDESNWRVCAQVPDAGQVVTGEPRLTVDRSCDGDTDGEPASDASAKPTEELPEVAPDASESETASADAMTIDSSPELAAVLEDPDYCSDAVADFAAEYAGHVVEFDGHIGAIGPHGSYDTRFDILVGASDFSETASPGPAFQFRDVNVTSDLGLTGSNIPETVDVGDNIHVVARIDSFETSSCLLLLEPVSTEFR